MPREPTLAIRDLLATNWIAANTSGITPTIHTGWDNVRAADTTQFSVTTPLDTPIDSGDTGYFAMDAGGGPPKQKWDGSVDGNVWAHERMTDIDTAGVDPQQFVWECVEEIRRIVRDNYDQLSGYDSIAVTERQRFDESDRSPTLYRYFVEISFIFMD